MASPRLLFASLLLLLLAVHLVDSRKVNVIFEDFCNPFEKLLEEMTKGTLVKESGVAVAGINCKGLCAVRCSKSSRPNLCHRACGTCCLRCNCVPPGTYGNYGSCPCYASLTTRGGARKCP